MVKINTMVKIDIVKEMMIQRNYKEKESSSDCIIGVNDENDHIYIKIFNSKFELNIIREFLCKNFDINSEGIIRIRDSEGCAARVAELVIVCFNFQNSHFKELKQISVRIQLIKSDFFNINITKKAPLHQKVTPPANLNKKEIPIIKEDDPNCIFYNFIKGDVIRVVRHDGDICYRLVK